MILRDDLVKRRQLFGNEGTHPSFFGQQSFEVRSGATTQTLFQRQCTRVGLEPHAVGERMFNTLKQSCETGRKKQKPTPDRAFGLGKVQRRARSTNLTQAPKNP